MNSLYHKDNFSWDCNVFSTIIRRENGRIEEAIKDFDACLTTKKDKIKNAPTGELVGTVDVPLDVAEGFAKAMRHLQNETVYNALFVMTNSYLEFSLVEICRFASIYLKKNFYTHSNDRGLDKVKTYLKDTLGIDVTSKKEWSDFKVNANIRNCIVHNSANVIVDYDKNLEDQPNYKVFTSNKNIEVTETGFLFINTLDFIKQNHQTANAFIKNLFDEVKTALEKLGHK